MIIEELVKITIWDDEEDAHLLQRWFQNENRYEAARVVPDATTRKRIGVCYMVVPGVAKTFFHDMGISYNERSSN